MKIYKISQQYDIYDFFDMIRENQQDILYDYIYSHKEEMDWRVIPFARLKKIWQDYARMGIVRDEKGLDMIVDMMLNNIARLQATTELALHTERGMKDILEEHGLDDEVEDKDTIKQIDKVLDGTNYEFYEDYLNTQYTTPISDYGLKPLMDLANRLVSATTDGEKIMIIDQMLQITHQRGDLAALFVEGGAKSLTDLFLN